MRILFIYSESMKNDLFKTDNNKPLYSNDQIPFGVSYISAVLKQGGHTTDVYVLSPRTTPKEACRYIERVRPDILAFSLVYREYHRMVDLAKIIREQFHDMFMVAGGTHITLHPDEAIEAGFNAICIGEGEETMLELANRMQKGEDLLGIKNIWLKAEGVVHKSALREFNCNLDALPFPDRDMWIPFIENTRTAISVLLGRGCNFCCAYCCNHAIKRAIPGQYVRFRTPENIFKEIEYIVEHYPEHDTVYFEVEAINSDMNFFEEFMTKLVEYNKSLPRTIHYGTNIRVVSNQDWNTIFKTMRRANIGFINIGLESGSARIRKDIMKRNYSNDDVLQAVQAAKKNRILTLLYAMMGLPTETKEEYEGTVEMIRKCRPNILHMGVFYPYPGTDLYKLCDDLHLLPKLKKDVGRNIASLDMPQFSRRQIQKEYNMFFSRMYAKTRFEFWYLYLLITLGIRLGSSKLNQIIMKRIGKRQIVEHYIR